MSLFTIGDLHLSIGINKPMDIFSGWEDYMNKLEQNWNCSVKDEDTVVIPGDISWAMSLDDALQDFSFLNELPGEKIILKGNHDYWWSTLTKMNGFLSQHGLNKISILHNNAYRAGRFCICGSRGWFYDNTCESDKKILLREAGRLETSVRAAEDTGLEPVAFLHYPPIYGEFYCEEIMDVLTRHKIKRCFYGHLHGKSTSTAFNGRQDGILFRLISADSLRFSPLLIDKY